MKSYYNEPPISTTQLLQLCWFLQVKNGFLEAADLGIFIRSRNRAKIEGTAAILEEKDDN